LKTIYIYILIDPRTESVRYVGKTNNPRLRFNVHTSRKFDKKSHRDMWVKQLCELGLKPLMVIVEETNEDHWKERERFWQLHFESLGADLTNINECGYGPLGTCKTPEGLAAMRARMHALNQRVDVREKISQAQKARFVNDPEYAEMMRNLHVGRKRSEETKQKMKQAHILRHKRKREEGGGKERHKMSRIIDGLIDPEGNAVPAFSNIRAFCEPLGLNPFHISSVISGKRPHHRGYTFNRRDDEINA
jgi:hypothetical protein